MLSRSGEGHTGTFLLWHLPSSSPLGQLTLGHLLLDSLGPGAAPGPTTLSSVFCVDAPVSLLGTGTAGLPHRSLGVVFDCCFWAQGSIREGAFFGLLCL